MADRRKNPSGYMDLTAYLALNNVENNDELDPDLLDYIKEKYNMLTLEFLVFPTSKEMLELMKCRSERSIDRQAIRIILDHWDKE